MHHHCAVRFTVVLRGEEGILPQAVTMDHRRQGDAERSKVFNMKDLEDP
jgi:hypothetical protein